MIHLNVCHPATGEPGWDRMEIDMNSRSFRNDRYLLLEDNSWHEWKSSSDGKSTFYRPHGETSGNWTDNSVLTNEQVLDRKSTVTSSYQIGYFSKGQFWANAVVGDLFEAIEKKNPLDDERRECTRLSEALEPYWGSSNRTEWPRTMKPIPPVLVRWRAAADGCAREQLRNGDAAELLTSPLFDSIGPVSVSVGTHMGMLSL